jgi:hypothetical protein
LSNDFLTHQQAVSTTISRNAGTGGGAAKGAKAINLESDQAMDEDAAIAAQ